MESACKTTKPTAKPKRNRNRRNRPPNGGGRTVAPLSYGLKVQTKQPSITTKGLVVNINHREFIGDVLGSVDYQVSKYSINPGLLRTFPWMASLGVNFEKYQVKSLAFHYESASSTIATGTVLMAIDMDASDSAPANKVQLMSYRGASRSNPWQSSTCLLPEPGKELYVRSGEPPTGTDIKLYDVGNLFIATQGQADGSPVGELYIDYSIDLRIPQAAATGGGAVVESSSFVNTSVALTTATVTGSLGAFASGAETIRVPASVGTHFLIAGHLEGTATGFTLVDTLEYDILTQELTSGAASTTNVSIITVTSVSSQGTFDLTLDLAGTVTQLRVLITEWDPSALV